MFQSLSSVYDAQILLASHSPVILSLVEPGQLLCFAKTEEGATDIVLGSDHPVLREWRGETNLSTLFASGVLGRADRDPGLRSWLLEEGYLDPNATKPARPKEAVENALRIARMPRSSALYRQLAERVSLRGCEDPASDRFCQVLRSWFPAPY